VGLEKLKQTHAKQIELFEAWAALDHWEEFHSSHYDWWTFPINKPSAYGLAWTVFEGDITDLKKDRIFIDHYLRGVDLVSASWGWSLSRKTYIEQPKTGQGWHNWPVRLFKAALSVKLFGYADHFESLKTLALEIMNTGEEMEYNGHDLNWLFITGIDPHP